MCVLTESNMTDTIARHVFDSVAWPIWIVNSYHGTLIDANLQGKGLLEATGVVRIEHDRLLPAERSADKAWRDALTLVGSGKSSYATAPVHSMRPAYFVFSAIGGESLFEQSVAVVLSGRAAYCTQLKGIQSAYGLTRAETKVLELLLSGRSLKEACGALGIMFTTARTHLRSIFTKTQTHRQAELMLLVNAFPPLTSGRETLHHAMAH